MAILNVLTTIYENQHDKVMTTHTRKIPRLLSREKDVDKHITKHLSHRLSEEVMAGFEKAYWKAESLFPTIRQS